MKKKDLWPEIDVAAHHDNPIQIIKEQAEVLSKKTKNIIVGEVVTNAENKVIYHSLYLNIPTLDNYRFALLKIAHTTMQYPLFIYDYSKSSGGIKPEYRTKLSPRAEIRAAVSASMTIDRLFETTEVVIPPPDSRANSPEEFIQELGKILSSDDTKSILNSLIAQTL